MSPLTLTLSLLLLPTITLSLQCLKCVGFVSQIQTPRQATTSRSLTEVLYTNNRSDCLGWQRLVNDNANLTNFIQSDCAVCADWTLTTRIKYNLESQDTTQVEDVKACLSAEDVQSLANSNLSLARASCPARSGTLSLSSVLRKGTELRTLWEELQKEVKFRKGELRRAVLSGCSCDQDLCNNRTSNWQKWSGARRTQYLCPVLILILIIISLAVNYN